MRGLFCATQIKGRDKTRQEAKTVFRNIVEYLPLQYDDGMPYTPIGLEDQQADAQTEWAYTERSWMTAKNRFGHDKIRIEMVALLIYSVA